MVNKHDLNRLTILPYIIFDHNKVIEVSDAIVELTGYMKDEMMGKDIKDIYNLFRLHISEAESLQNKKSYFIFRKDYKPMEVEFSIEAYQEENRSIIILKYKPEIRFRDTSYICEICKSNIMAFALYSVPDMILLKVNQKYLYFVQESYNLIEKSIGKRAGELIEGWEGSYYQSVFQEAIQKGHSIKVEEADVIGSRDHITYWDSIITPIFDDDKKAKYLISVSSDATERVLNRKRIEEQSLAIKKQKEQLELVMENVLESVSLFDKHGNYILLNKTGKTYFGENLKKIGDSFSFTEYFDLDGNKLSFEQTPGYYVLRGKTISDQIMLMKLPTKSKYLSVTGSPIFDDNGEVLFGLITMHDVTEKIKHEQALKQHQVSLLKAQRLEKKALEKAVKMKDEFLITITHEFKTPLTVINAAIDVIQSIYSSQLSDGVKRHIQRIRMNSLRQLRLVNNLLDITLYKAGYIKTKKQNIDIVFLTSAILKSVIPFAKQKGVTLLFSSDIEYKEMALDYDKYERIMLNLLSNAIKFTQKGKCVYVDITCKNRKVIIRLKDEGIGVPKKKQKFIFERFGQVDSSLTRQAEGTGIGLSLVNVLVNALGGSITLDSILGKGSTFTVTLPISRVRGNDDLNSRENIPDNRIMQAAEIEFYDIYLN